MRIGMIAPPWFPLPPQRYGGIEFVVSLLTEGLVARGHDVTLFASGDSATRARLSYIFARAPFEQMENGDHLEVMHSLEAYTRARRVRRHPRPRRPRQPRHGRARPPAHRHAGGGHAARPRRPHHAAGARARCAPTCSFIAISDYQRSGFPDLDFVGTIPNAIDVEHMPFSAEKDDYLLFIGRMTPDKGAHTAIDVAQRLDRRLIMAGKVNEGPEREYFAAEVEPHLSDNIHFRGEVDHETKVRALQARPLHAVPHPVAGAVRPRDDRVARLRHARHRHAPGLGARGDRARPHRVHRRHGRRDGRGVRAHRRDRPGRVPARGGGAVRERGVRGRARGRLPRCSADELWGAPPAAPRSALSSARGRRRSCRGGRPAGRSRDSRTGSDARNTSTTRGSNWVPACRPAPAGRSRSAGPRGTAGRWSWRRTRRRRAGCARPAGSRRRGSRPGSPRRPSARAPSG